MSGEAETSHDLAGATIVAAHFYNARNDSRTTFSGPRGTVRVTDDGWAGDWWEGGMVILELADGREVEFNSEADHDTSSLVVEIAPCRNRPTEPASIRPPAG